MTTIQETIQYLERGQTILYPTNTVWGIGCDATNAEAVARIYAIKQRAESKALITLLATVAQLKEYVAEIPPVALELIENTDRPTTIIYQNPQKLAPNLIAADNTVAIRLTNHAFCHQLIQKYNKPIISTSANISGQATAASFEAIDEKIKEAVDFIVPLEFDQKAPNLDNRPSKIVKILPNGELYIIRP